MNETLQETTEEQKRASLPWDDITDAERILRLQYVVKQEQNRISKLQGDVYELRQMIHEHRHGDDHKVLVPSNMMGNARDPSCDTLVCGSDKPWF